MNDAQKLEDDAKAESAYMLFYISNPGTEGGNQVSAYSLVEAVIGLYDNPAPSLRRGHQRPASQQARLKTSIRVMQGACGNCAIRPLR